MKKRTKIIIVSVLIVLMIIAIGIYLFIENSKYYTLHTTILSIEINKDKKGITVEDTVNKEYGSFRKYFFSACNVKIVDRKGKRVKVDDLSVGDSIDIISKQEVYDLMTIPSLESRDIKKVIVTKK